MTTKFVTRHRRRPGSAESGYSAYSVRNLSISMPTPNSANQTFNAWLISRAHPRRPISQLVVLLLALTAGGLAQTPNPEDRLINIVAPILRWHGFEPNQVTIPPGKTRFEITNRTGLEEIELIVDREASENNGNERLERKKSPRQDRSWKSDFNLFPGTYQVTEATHPEWIFTLTVSATAKRPPGSKDAPTN